MVDLLAENRRMMKHIHRAYIPVTDETRQGRKKYYVAHGFIMERVKEKTPILKIKVNK